MKQIIAIALCVLLLAGCTQQQTTSSSTSSTSTSTQTQTTSSVVTGPGPVTTEKVPVMAEDAVKQLQKLTKSPGNPAVLQPWHVWGNEVSYVAGTYDGDYEGFTGAGGLYSYESDELESLGIYINQEVRGLNDYAVMPNGARYEFTNYQQPDGAVVSGVVEVDIPGGAMNFYRVGEELDDDPMPRYTKLNDETLLVFYTMYDIRHTYSVIASFNVNSKAWTELYMQQADIGTDNGVELLENAAVVNGELLLFRRLVSEADFDSAYYRPGDFEPDDGEIIVDVCDLEGNVLRRIENPGFDMPTLIRVVDDRLFFTYPGQALLDMWQFDGAAFHVLDFVFAIDYPDDAPNAIPEAERTPQVSLANARGQFDAEQFPYLYLGVNADSVLYLMDMRTNEISWVRLWEDRGLRDYALYADAQGNLCIYETLMTDRGEGTFCHYALGGDIVSHMQPMAQG